VFVFPKRELVAGAFEFLGGAEGPPVEVDLCLIGLFLLSSASLAAYSCARERELDLDWFESLLLLALEEAATAGSRLTRFTPPLAA